jgi:hypothetical protein
VFPAGPQAIYLCVPYFVSPNELNVNGNTVLASGYATQAACLAVCGPNVGQP